jgi:hypothetical protein
MRSIRVTWVAGVAFAIAGVGALKVGTGCANVLGIDSDRHVAVDAGSDASAYPPGWECLGTPDLVADGGTVKIRFQLLDSAAAMTAGAAGTPIVGASIDACGLIDFACANPIHEATTDDAGTVIFSLASGFDGYYEVPTATGFNPSLFFRPPQYVDQTQPQGMADMTDIGAAGTIAGVTQDPTLGFAIISANDCNGNSAGGIQFSIANATPTETIVYLKSSIPSTSANQTDATTGSALIFNVPVGKGTMPQSLSASASFASTGALVQTITGIGRAGFVSYLAIEPDQSRRNPF